MAGAKKAVFSEGTAWMKDTLLNRKTYDIRNTDPKCQRTLLRFQSNEFGPVRIVRQSNLYNYKKSEVQNHRLVVLGPNDRLLAELHYSPRKFGKDGEIKIHQIHSVEDNRGLASSLLAVLCHLTPGLPKTLNAVPTAFPKYEHLGFVPCLSGSSNMQLKGDRLTPQEWVKRNYLVFKGKRKVFIK